MLQDRFSLMAFSAVMDAMASANRQSATPVFEIHTVGLSTTTTSDVGLRIPIAVHTADLDVAAQDLLVICGGSYAMPLLDPVIQQRLSEPLGDRQVLGGLLSGSYALVNAGLLKGQACALPGPLCALMTDAFPEVAFVPEGYTVSPRRFTCSTAASAMEMILTLLKRDWGRHLACAVEQELVGGRLLGWLSTAGPNIISPPNGLASIR